MDFLGKLGRTASRTKEDLKFDMNVHVSTEDALDALTNACLVETMFAKTFLRNKNQDCLDQVLSFLTCKELLASAQTCETLHHLIFEASDEEGHINMIGHEPHDRNDYNVGNSIE